MFCEILSQFSWAGYELDNNQYSFLPTVPIGRLSIWFGRTILKSGEKSAEVSNLSCIFGSFYKKKSRTVYINISLISTILGNGYSYLKHWSRGLTLRLQLTKTLDVPWVAWVACVYMSQLWHLFTVHSPNDFCFTRHGCSCYERKSLLCYITHRYLLPSQT